jgi:gliding motility-associated-like protein
MEDTYSFCEDSYVVIDAPQGYDAYIWLYNEKVVGNSYHISANKAGEYTLRVTKNNNGLFCNVTKTIYVHESAKPIIKNIEVSDMSENNNYIEVVTVEEGNYEYSIDGSNWQDSPRFDNLKSGEYTVLVNDKNGCGMAEGEALILMYPKYFTPNGDGHHDKWQVENAWKDMSMEVTIFDRYGKVMAAFTGNSAGWDGTYNGTQLPSTDYWFVVNRGNGKQYKGHFSMMR